MRKLSLFRKKYIGRCDVCKNHFMADFSDFITVRYKEANKLYSAVKCPFCNCYLYDSYETVFLCFIFASFWKVNGTVEEVKK